MSSHSDVFIIACCMLSAGDSREELLSGAFLQVSLCGRLCRCLGQPAFKFSQQGAHPVPVRMGRLSLGLEANLFA